MPDLAKMINNIDGDGEETSDEKKVVYIGHGNKVNVYYGLNLSNKIIQIDYDNPRKSLYDQIKSYAGIPEGIDYSEVLIITKTNSSKLRGELYKDNKKLTLSHIFDIEITEKNLDKLLNGMKDRTIIATNDSYELIEECVKNLGYKIVDFS